MEETTHQSKSHKKGGLKKTKPLLACVVVAVVIAGLSFYVGMQYQKGHQKNTNSAGNFSRGGFGGGFGGRFGQDRVIGQVTAISGTSISVDDNRTNQTMTLSITSSTQISDNGQSVSASDIKTGDTVFITENSSNTSQAANILVNPSFGGFGQNQNTNSSTTPNNSTLN